MPINPPNINGVTNRRMASPKRNNSIMSSEYPVVTKTVYDGLIRGQGGDANITMKRLVAGKHQMSRLLQTLDASMSDHNPQMNAQPSATYNRLRQIRTVIEREFLKYPLTIA
jgi:hypothetical protein